MARLTKIKNGTPKQTNKETYKQNYTRKCYMLNPSLKLLDADNGDTTFCQSISTISLSPQESWPLLYQSRELVTVVSIKAVVFCLNQFCTCSLVVVHLHFFIVFVVIIIVVIVFFFFIVVIVHIIIIIVIVFFCQIGS